METFKPTCDNHIPVKPPEMKNIKKNKIPIIGASHLKAPLINVNVQLIILTVAGNEIITVIVLNNARLR
jgi:hypothetical protein